MDELTREQVRQQQQSKRKMLAHDRKKGGARAAAWGTSYWWARDKGKPRRSIPRKRCWDVGFLHD
jgi:hypothetical protein